MEDKIGLQHKERLLRKVHVSSNGSAEIEYRDYFINPETNQRTHSDAAYKGASKVDAALIHEDLREAIAAFEEHWLIIGEEVPEPKANYPFDRSIKRLEQTTVTSVTLSGGEPVQDELEERKPIGVHVQGTFRLKCGRTKNYCTPGIKIGSVQEKYRFAVQMATHLEALEREAWAYMAGKCTPPAQTALNLEPHNEDDGDAVLLEPAN